MDCLIHHGVKGQKWGVRRYQNKDGSLTPAGKKRYSPPHAGRSEQIKNVIREFGKASLKSRYNQMLSRRLGDDTVNAFASKGKVRLLALPLQAYSYTQLSKNYSSFIDELFDN